MNRNREFEACDFDPTNLSDETKREEIADAINEKIEVAGRPKMTLLGYATLVIAAIAMISSGVALIKGGPEGPMGPQGDRGPIGLVGLQGPAGKDGSNATLPAGLVNFDPTIVGENHTSSVKRDQALEEKIGELRKELKELKEQKVATPPSAPSTPPRAKPVAEEGTFVADDSSGVEKLVYRWETRGNFKFPLMKNPHGHITPFHPDFAAPVPLDTTAEWQVAQFKLPDGRTVGGWAIPVK